MRGKVGRAKTSQEYSLGTIMTSITYMLFKYIDAPIQQKYRRQKPRLLSERRRMFNECIGCCALQHTDIREHSSYPGARRFDHLPVALFAFVGCTVRAQQSCSVTLPTRIPTAANIFSAQQERMLGDIEAELLESNYHAACDEELAAHLNAVAGRVLSQFPPQSGAGSRHRD